MATHSIWAFTVRSSANVSTRSQEKHTWRKLLKPASQISHKNKNLPALSGDGMWKKYQEKMAQQSSMAQDCFGSTTPLDPWKSPKDKNNKTLPSVVPTHYFFSFPPRQNQGALQKSSQVQSASSPVSPKPWAPSCPWKPVPVSSFDRNYRLEGTAQTGGLSQPNLAKC